MLQGDKEAGIHVGSESIEDRANRMMCEQNKQVAIIVIINLSNTAVDEGTTLN